MKMPKTKLKKNMTIKEFQDYMHELNKLNGWDKNTYAVTMLLLTEEVGELAKAVRKVNKLYSEDAKIDKNARLNLAEEISDVMSYLMDVANMHGIDVSEAIINKDKENKKRKWD